MFNGATTGERFLAYVSDMLIPILKRGDPVICNDLSVHKVAGVRETIEAAGAHLLYLPPDSPDFNPCMDGSCGSRMSDRFG
ncbi:hypothetical protein FV229_12550 [Methylobacterium sp. WL120]|nr:hypothetical protein FV229_12550 [Methylobacterium sp. WL120]